MRLGLYFLFFYLIVRYRELQNRVVFDAIRRGSERRRRKKKPTNIREQTTRDGVIGHNLCNDNNSRTPRDNCSCRGIPRDSPRKIVTVYLLQYDFRLLFCRQTDELRRQRAPEVFVRAQAHISGMYNRERARRRIRTPVTIVCILLRACSPGARV